jgi:hypothetical protein
MIPFHPVAAFRTGMALSLMMVEAQQVIALRLMGMAGVWAVAPGENSRMVSEKLPALAEAGQAAMLAAMTGGRPDQVAAAWVKPVGRRTRANARRLYLRGPSLRG